MSSLDTDLLVRTNLLLKHRWCPDSGLHYLGRTTWATWSTQLRRSSEEASSAAREQWGPQNLLVLLIP